MLIHTVPNAHPVPRPTMAAGDTSNTHSSLAMAARSGEQTPNAHFIPRSTMSAGVASDMSTHPAQRSPNGHPIPGSTISAGDASAAHSSSATLTHLAKQPPNADPIPSSTALAGDAPDAHSNPAMLIRSAEQAPNTPPIPSSTMLAGDASDMPTRSAKRTSNTRPIPRSTMSTGDASGANSGPATSTSPAERSPNAQSIPLSSASAGDAPDVHSSPAILTRSAEQSSNVHPIPRSMMQERDPSNAHSSSINNDKAAQGSGSTMSGMLDKLKQRASSLPMSSKTPEISVDQDKEQFIATPMVPSSGSQTYLVSAQDTNPKGQEQLQESQVLKSWYDPTRYISTKFAFKLGKHNPKTLLPTHNAGKKAWNALSRKEKEVKEVRTEEIKAQDTVIALMGPTGSGKSSFISKIMGYENGVGHSLESCTSEINAVRVKLFDEDIEVVFVDTPGFDDTNKTDLEILSLISDWLQKTYGRGILLSGILYLHRITDNRMAGTPLKNLKMFEKLCGPEACRHIIMVTTMWDELDKEETGVTRELELTTTFWKSMIKRGSITIRYENTTESAWSITGNFLGERGQRALHLQKEMVDLKRTLPNTDAGQALYDKIKELVQKQKKLKEMLEKQMERLDGNEEVLSVLKEQCLRLQTEQEETVKELNDLQISPGKRLMRALSMQKRYMTLFV